MSVSKILKIAAYFDYAKRYAEADRLMSLCEKMTRSASLSTDEFYYMLQSLVNEVHMSGNFDSSVKNAILFPLREVRDLLISSSGAYQKDLRNDVENLSQNTNFMPAAGQKVAQVSRNLSDIQSDIQMLIQAAASTFIGQSANLLPKIQGLLANALKYASEPTSQGIDGYAQKGQDELSRDTLIQRYLAYGMKYGDRAMIQHLQKNQTTEFTNQVLDQWRDLQLQQSK
jgi:hypothetical protein